MRNGLLVGKEKPGNDNLRNFHLVYLNIWFAVNQSPQQCMFAARQTPRNIFTVHPKSANW